MFKENRNALIIAIIAIVNALGYGIIVPVLYSYSHKFGINDFENGLLFALFSIGQFVSTPIIGRMSDKYGRKPLLLISLSGTALSFLLMAFAPNAAFLFLARALDGITAGNLPVAMAVITDSTSMENRAKGFGIIGASFGFGFIFGPALSAFTVGISPALPFIIAGVVSIVAVLITFLFLPETNKHIGQVKAGKLFDFKKMLHALTDQNVGPTFLITLVYSFAFAMFIYAFQPFSVEVLGLSTNQISIIYTAFGVIGLITQLFIFPKITKIFGLKPAFSFALMLMSLSFLSMFLVHSFVFFVISAFLLGMSNSIIQPLTLTILSAETDAKSQGTIQGLNASYMSIGQIFGPIIGGALATVVIVYPFLAGCICAFIGWLLSFNVLKPGVKKESAF